MHEIGAWVLGAACRQMRDWQALAWQPFRLAVNVSASQVGSDFDGWVPGQRRPPLSLSLKTEDPIRAPSPPSMAPN